MIPLSLLGHDECWPRALAPRDTARDRDGESRVAGAAFRPLERRCETAGSSREFLLVRTTPSAATFLHHDDMMLLSTCGQHPSSEL